MASRPFTCNTVEQTRKCIADILQKRKACVFLRFLNIRWFHGNVACPRELLEMMVINTRGPVTRIWKTEPLKNNSSPLVYNPFCFRTFNKEKSYGSAFRLKKKKRRKRNLRNRPSKVNREATAPPTASEKVFLSSWSAFRLPSQFKYAGYPLSSQEGPPTRKLLSALGF